MNPFSGFLQPPQQRSPLAGAGEFMADMSRLSLARQQEANRVKEAGTDNARADQYLKLQQTDQASRLGQQDQKQVEALLAEYQDAEDQGDPIRLSRAAQMLKRFGMDVTPGKAPSLAGALPSPASLQAEPDLPQGEFEEQLIESTQAAPARYEVGGETAPEFKKQIGLDGALPVDLGDVDSPEFKAAASAEAVDMGDVDSPEFRKAARDEQRPELKNTAPPQLAGGLPTVISRGGKTLYESTGPSGRWTPMVQGVFQPFTQHENQDIGAAAQRAQQVATKLIEVDGVAPKDAIKMGIDYLNGEANRINGIMRNEIAARPKWGGGGGGAATGVNAKGRLPLSREMTATVRLYKNENIETGLRGYESALAALNSNNVASQNDALNQLIATRSGKTVSDRERALYNRAAGLWEQVKKSVNMAAGEPMPEEFRGQLRQLMGEAQQVLIDEREQRAKAAEKFHSAKMRGAMTPEEVQQDAAGVADAVRFGGDPGPAADSEEALY